MGLFSREILVNGNHTAHLLHAEGTAFFAMSTVQAGICFRAQLGVVIGGNIIPRQGQIVILVHEANVDTCGAGLAVVTVFL